MLGPRQGAREGAMKPRRKALVVSVLDYPHVGQKHGGSTSGCFTDALLVSRMLSNYYGFSDEKDDLPIASETSKGSEGSEGSVAEKGKSSVNNESIDIEICDDDNEDATLSEVATRISNRDRIESSIRVCCTYGWNRSESYSNTSSPRSSPYASGRRRKSSARNLSYAVTHNYTSSFIKVIHNPAHLEQLQRLYGQVKDAENDPSTSNFARRSSVEHYLSTGTWHTSEEADCNVDHTSDTHANVLKSLEWLARDAGNGDTLVFYFTGCSTYKLIASTGGGTKGAPRLEPVLCLGDFSWENDETGFLDCEALHSVLLGAVEGKDLELVVILDTHLGPMIADLLQQRTEALDSESFRSNVKFGYASLPRNRSRALPLPPKERGMLKRIMGQRRVRAKWHSLVIGVSALTSMISKTLKKRKSFLAGKYNSRVSPLPMAKTAGAAAREDESSASGAERATSGVPQISIEVEGAKIVILAAEPTHVRRVEKINKINSVKFGPLVWVLYTLLKSRLVRTRGLPIQKSLEKMVEMLHPKLAELPAAADETFERKWQTKHQTPYRCVLKTIGLSKDDLSRHRLFHRVHSAESASAGPGMRDSRTLSLTRQMADFVETPPKREKSKARRKSLRLAASQAAAKLEELEQRVDAEEKGVTEGALPPANHKVNGKLAPLKIPKSTLPPLDRDKAKRKLSRS